MYRDVLSKNSHKFPIIISSRNICSFAVKSFMMVAIALFLGFRNFSSFFVEEFLRFMTALFLEFRKIRGPYRQPETALFAPKVVKEVINEKHSLGEYKTKEIFICSHNHKIRTSCDQGKEHRNINPKHKMYLAQKRFSSVGYCYQGTLADRATLAGISNENELLILCDMIYLSNVIFPEESESVLRFLIALLFLNLSAF